MPSPHVPITVRTGFLLTHKKATQEVMFVLKSIKRIPFVFLFTKPSMISNIAVPIYLGFCFLSIFIRIFRLLPFVFAAFVIL